MRKKIITVLLSAMMAMVFIPSASFAAEDDASDVGTAEVDTCEEYVDMNESEEATDDVLGGTQKDEEVGSLAGNIETAPDELTFDAQAAPAVNMISAKRYKNNIRITWDSALKTSNIQFGLIYCSTNSSALGDWSEYTAETPIYSDADGHLYMNISKLALNKVRYFAIISYNQSDDSYKLSGNTVKYTPVLVTPTATAIVTGTTSVKISWNKDTCATSYKIYRSTKKTSGFKCIKTVGGYSTTSFTNKGLTKGKTYYFKVRAYRNSSYKTSSVKSAKPRANVSPWIKTFDKKISGNLYLEKGQVSYYKGMARFKLKIYNNSTHKAVKFNNITICIYDNNGNKIAKQTFNNIPLDLGAHKTKYKTFKFSYNNTYRHNTNLRYLNSKAGFTCGYQYTYILF